MSYSATVLADSPIGYWRLDEASGNFADSSGNGYTGTVTGSPTYSQPAAASIDGTSVTLDGSTTYATASPTLLSSKTTITVEAWCKTTSATTFRGILGSLGSGQQFQFRFNSGKPEVIFFSGGGTAHVLTGPSSLADGAWHHVVATMSAGGVATLYVDGLSVASISGFTQVAITGVSLLIGRAFSTDPPWLGSLDELAVYGTALSSTQVAAHYSASHGGHTASATLTATATLSSGPVLTRRPTPTLATVASLSTARTRTQPRSASLNATATLSTAPVRTKVAATTLNAVATLSSLASTALTASANLAATATLAATAVRSKIAAATLAAVAALNSATVRTRQRTAQLDTAATLISSARGGKTANTTLNAVATLLSAPARPLVAPVAGPFEWGFQMLAPAAALIPVEAGLDFIEFGFAMLQPGDALIGDPA